MKAFKSYGNSGLRYFSVVVVLGVWISAALHSAPITEAYAMPRQTEHRDHRQMPAQKHYSRSIAHYSVPNVMLVDMTGAKVSLLSELNYDGPVLVQFIFATCPTICPPLSGIFSAVQKKFGPDLDRIRMISISIDPEYDTPSRLREYAKKFKAKRQWHFLTGALEDIVAVQKAFDAYRNNKMAHEPLTFLRSSPKESWVRLDGLMSAEDLVAEYRQVIAQ
jgi:protein SCO1